MKFQKNLIVWKPKMRGSMLILLLKFQKNLIVWKLLGNALSVINHIPVSEELNSVETICERPVAP